MRSRVYQLSGGYASWNPHWSRIGWRPRSTSVAVWRLQSRCRVGQQDGEQRATRVSLSACLKTCFCSMRAMRVCIKSYAVRLPPPPIVYLYPSHPPIKQKMEPKRKERVFPVRPNQQQWRRYVFREWQASRQRDSRVLPENMDAARVIKGNKDRGDSHRDTMRNKNPRECFTSCPLFFSSVSISILLLLDLDL